jgi:diketogulonate reductase-like aldo/keto reductase
MLALASPWRAAAGGPMTTRPIPRGGDESLPVIGLGTWQVFDVGSGAEDRAPLLEVVRRFLAGGGRVIDSSPMYGKAEAVTGDLVAEAGPLPRPFLATKVWTTGKAAGEAQMRESMRRMRADRIDLLQVHNLLDWESHLPVLRAWKERGLVRYVGITHYSPSAFPLLERLIATERPDFVQLPYSISSREAEKRLLPAAAAAGVAVLVMRPFEEGALFSAVKGKPLPPWAAEIGAASWAQVFLKYVVSHPAVTSAIPATRRPEHMTDNLGAGSGPFPDEKMRRRMAADFRA